TPRPSDFLTCGVSEMSRTAANYLILVVTLGLPVLAFSVRGVPDILLSFVSLIALAGIVVVAMSLRAGKLKDASPLVKRHAAIQRRILILCVVGGLSTAFRMFSYYEQFQFELSLETPLLIVTILCWLAILVLLTWGVALFLRDWSRTLTNKTTA
ncbi:MAG: hypothetical protein AAGJ70_14305, partial [Pseudomonadota bacterium]